MPQTPKKTFRERMLDPRNRRSSNVVDLRQPNQQPIPLPTDLSQPLPLPVDPTRIPPEVAQDMLNQALSAIIPPITIDWPPQTRRKPATRYPVPRR